MEVITNYRYLSPAHLKGLNEYKVTCRHMACADFLCRTPLVQCCRYVAYLDLHHATILELVRRGKLIAVSLSFETKTPHYVSSFHAGSHRI